MAKFEHKPGKGMAFQNEKKSDNAPDFRGTFKQLDGREMQIAIWNKQDRNGNPALSISVQEPYRGS